MDLYLDPRVLTINRSTYDILDCLGDIGGFVRAIVLISNILLLPITTFNLKSFLLTIMFRLVPSRKENNTYTQSIPESVASQNVLRRSTTFDLLKKQN